MDELVQTAAMETSESAASAPADAGNGVVLVSGATELPFCPPPPRTSDLPVILSLLGVLIVTRLAARAIRRRQGI